jgi:phosphoglycerol transferase MdoB-like AlkP superfamily enzyme
LWIYAPKYFPPQRVHQLMGQLDIPPTLLGMLNFSYRTRFFGQDVSQVPASSGHAFPGTYEKLGYLRNNVLTVLEPQRKLEQFKPDYDTGDATPVQPQNQALIDQTVAYYQVSSELFKQGKLILRSDDATPVAPTTPIPPAASSVAAPASASSAGTSAH